MLRRAACAFAACAAALVPALPAAAATHPAHTPAPAHTRPAPAPAPERKPEPRPSPAPAQHHPVTTPVPKPSGIPTPLPSASHHPRRPAGGGTSGSRGSGSHGSGSASGGPAPAAWAPDSWLDYVQLADARDREARLREEQATLESLIADARAQEEELDRQLAAGAGREQDLGAQSLAEAFRLRTLDVQLAALAASGSRTQSRLDFAKLLTSRPDLLLKAIAGGDLLRTLLEGLANAPAGGPAGELEARHAAEISAARSLGAQRQLSLGASTRIGVDLLTLRDTRAGQQSRAQALKAGIAESQAQLADVSARVGEAQQQAWDATAALEDPDFSTLSAGHSTVYRFVWPEPNAWISQGFGPSALLGEPAYLGYAHFHQGVDLAAPMNSIVYAADDGVVIATVTGNYGYGNYVMLAHPGGVVTLYGHLNRILVSYGDHVIQGQPVGLEGSTGYSTGPHLHFEVRVDGAPVDPLPFLPDGGPSSYRR